MPRSSPSVLAVTLGLLLVAGTAAAAPVAASAPADSFFVVGGDTVFVVAPIEVLGSRVPAALPGTLRPVGSLEAAEIARSAASAPVDALQREPAVVTGQRQAFGVQADLSLRGSTFEQVQVLLDGFDLSDPQTGHHLLDLPLSLQDVARLEVLPGHGSSLYGSGAFGGVVNVVPARPARAMSGSVGGLAGPFGTWALRGEVTVPVGPQGVPPGEDPRAPIADRGRGLRISGERFRTDGHDVAGQWSGRDADITTSTVRYLDAAPGRLTDVFFGYADRAYGAQDFYAPAPGFEQTETTVFTARHRQTVGRLVIEPRAAVRRHRDLFTLYRDEPLRYRNDHLTRRALAGVRGAAPLLASWQLAADLEGAYEDIDSDGIRQGTPGDALGDHLRRRGSAAVELTRTAAPLRLQLGSRLDAWTGYAPRWTASAAVAWQPRPLWRVHGAAGSVYRIPTFTELYYEDPFNRGNPELAPETGWSWDAGLDRDDGTWAAGVTYFERHEDDLIDWGRPAGSAEPWQVRNVAEGRARGVELRAGWRHGRGHRVDVGYQYLDRETDIAPGTEAKYELVAPRHHLTGTALVVLPRGLSAALTGRWIERTGGPAGFREYAVFDLRLRWHTAPWTVTLDLRNLLDRRYAEIPGAVLPGRMAIAGAEVAF